MKRTFIITVIIMIILITYQSVPLFRNFLHIIFPASNVTFNYDQKPVNVTIGKVNYLIPKAYIQHKKQRSGGNLSEIYLWASKNDDMAPWPGSQSFKAKDSDSLIFIEIRGSLRQEYSKEFPCTEIKRYRKWYQEQENLDVSKFDGGIYKEIFHRYNRIDAKGRISGEFFLIPVEKEKYPYEITCPSIGNPEYLRCTVTRVYNPYIWYNFMMDMKNIENFLEYDQEVEKLINSLIIKET